MKFTTRQIPGRGRGKFLGFPTINMEIPAHFDLEEGIYAVWVTIEKKKFPGALHYGPIPTFGENQKSLEVFLMDATEKQVHSLNTKSIQVAPIRFIREVRSFPSSEALVRQMQKDIVAVRAAFLAQ